ncbi:MAG: aminotransferase class I/II-fold pyridoxal phosphate-dependent enzyme [Planctomycetota bacterium]|nr:MAG: aminotransferase class I/II-fold pyridoxal phosphate-dependent enzyme [Planctomycetota bacterium]
MELAPLEPSLHLKDVRYEIRGPLSRRALELERSGYDIIKLNIGNPGAFGFDMPDTMRRAIVENLRASEAYCHQKGIFPAREAVVMEQQSRGVMNVTAEEVFIGNGVSELIMMCMRALLNPGDEVLVPSPDYPLWTASVVIHGGKALHYPCSPDNNFYPDPEAIRAQITPRTRALVIINPNNPTGAVYPLSLLRELVSIAEEYGLIIFADEIYGHMTYEKASFIPLATLVNHTLCGTFSGLSKIYRACGLRVGWLSFSGELGHAKPYLQALELLASLRLCSNVPGQWAVQTAIGGYQSIRDLVLPGGRLYESRRAIIDACAASKYLYVNAPEGAMYAFVGISSEIFPDFDDQQFAMDLLEQKHVLLAPGVSFNVPYRNYFRMTLLPTAEQMREVFKRIEDLLRDYELQRRRATGGMQ